MPIIHVTNAGELSHEQRERLAAELTDVVHRVTGKGKQYVYVRIDEVPRSAFAVGGKLLGGPAGGG